MQGRLVPRSTIVPPSLVPRSSILPRPLFQTNFTPLDWVVVAVYLLGIAWVGMRVNRHIHNSADYLVGGRAAGTALSIASFIGTGLGLVTLMYAAQSGFNKGPVFLFVPLVWLVATVLLGGTGIVIARLRDLRLVTIPEYFQRRYSRRVRVLAGTICALAGILNMGLFPKMGATFLANVAGWGGAGEEAEIVVNWIMTGMLLLVLAYTVLGGMVAVIVTDYIQFVVLSLGLALGLVFCLTEADVSWASIVAAMQEHKGEAAFNPVFSGFSGWVFVVWQTLLATTAAFCWAPEVTRALTTVDVAATRRMFFFGAPGFFARMAIPAVWGMAAFAYFMRQPEYSAHFSDPAHAVQAMPLLVGKVVPAGLLGLLVAGLLAAFMSTHDSYLLAWSSVISRDIVGPLSRRRELSDRASILVTRISIVAIGVFLLVWGIWYQLPENVWTYMGVTGTVYLSGAAAALVGGMYWRRASSTGATWALLGGLAALPSLFVETLQRALAGVDLHAEQLGSEESAALNSVAAWLNAHTIALGAFVLCPVLLIAGSLLFPDRSSAEVNGGGMSPGGAP